MHVYLGSDHAGFELKSHLFSRLPTLGYETVDCGPASYVDGDDYTPYCIETARRVASDHGSLGVVIGGSGNGEQISANKVRDIRAALAWNDETARLAREHNDAHIVSIGARMHRLEEASRFVEIFLATPFSNDPRHQRRLDEIAAYEASAGPPAVR